MRRIEIAKILRNESDFLAKYFLSNPSEISNFNKCEEKEDVGCRDRDLGELCE